MAALIFYTNPMSRGRIARWMLEEVGQPYRHGPRRLRPADEGARVPGAEPDGQGADARARRHRRHRVRRDLRLPRRRLPRGRPRPASRRGAAPTTAGCSSRAGPLEAAVTNQSLGVEVPEGAPRHGRLRQRSPRVLDALETRRRAAATSPATVSPPPTSTSARRSAGACASAPIEPRPAFTEYWERIRRRPAARPRRGDRRRARCRRSRSPPAEET